MKRACLLVLLVGGLAPVQARAENWVHWRGPEQTGWSADQDLPDHFATNPGAKDSNVVWKQPYGGRSTPLIMNGRVYLINDAGEGIHEQERVMCFDADTGKVLWQYRFNVFFTDIVSARVGWANLSGDPETGNVYAHGVQGLLFCFDKDGKVLWWHSLTEEYGRISGYGGRVNSPVVDGDLVIIGMPNASWGDQAKGADRYVAFNKRNGKVVWWSQPGEILKGTYYSGPVVAVIHGQRQLITGGSDGAVHGIQVRTGVPLWGYTLGAKAINSSPVVDGSRVYIGHGEENLDTTEQGRIICVDASQVVDGKPKLVWKRDGITVKFASPILHDGRLYVCDESGRMYCLDAATGKDIWKFKYGKSSVGSPVLADGKIYVEEVGARFHILKPGPKSCQELQAVLFRSKDGTTAVECNGTPAVANGKIYFNTSEEMYCIGKKDWHGPDRLQASTGLPKGKLAHLLVYPADVVLKPGETADFKVRAFDENGEFLKEVKAEWSLPSPPPPPGAKMAPPPLQGTISPEGRLSVAKMPPGQFGTVLAKAEGLAGKARVRVVPSLPIKQDFEKVPEGRTPGGWVNAPGKFAVEQLGNSKVLRKLATNPNPQLARAYTFMAMPDLTDYTIESDVMGTQKGSDLPDMGVVANRYLFFLDGNKQRLRIVSWEALPRVDKTIPWPWQPGVWYRLKLTVEVQGDKALVRGKVWPRDKEEPKAWTLEFEDPTPNKEGSPALYGYATGILENAAGTDIFYDNVSVTPNHK